MAYWTRGLCLSLCIASHQDGRLRAVRAKRMLHPSGLYPALQQTSLLHALGWPPRLCVEAGDKAYAVIKMPSGEQRRVLARCHATIGVLSNPQHKNRKLGKAGARRWLGRRPVTRGVAMNAVDHPHGGGRGKRKGRISQTPWGVPTKGYKTRKSKNRTDAFIHLSRHKIKKSWSWCCIHAS